ncbi:hypothetical protein [Furfurilactobacillus rossiae]|uniref:Uncharacterized protein n=1 Tax=Furfurilactobacillus rossiae DSM 15814 TaxID=1114972 RepID=A0A0R1R8I8_9LACO|nr:hypothetical protein [Furfurilactobacillus rossiae]KRL53057.1 hypothetical protein FD35_GL001491 [Furfurilactobacillus rossiae DSM 15814]QFR66404.1 hypothetical protein LR814_04555 [Furfurilactobacillus rossiae]QLE61860.1 hypothetical protein LROSRS0_1815 [Furfurilactobacillus rossiae]
MGVLGTTISAVVAAGVGAIFASVRTDRNAKYLGSDWRQRLEKLCELDRIKPSNLRQLRFSVNTHMGNEYFDSFDVSIGNIRGYNQKAHEEKTNFKECLKWICPWHLPANKVIVHTGYFDQLIINFCDKALNKNNQIWWHGDKTLKDAYADTFRQFCALLLKAQWVVLDQKGRFKYQMLTPKRGGDDALLEGYWIIKKNLPDELHDLMGNAGRDEKDREKQIYGYIDLVEVAPKPWLERWIVKLYSLLAFLLCPAIAWITTGLFLHQTISKISWWIAVGLATGVVVSIIFRLVVIFGYCDRYEQQRLNWRETEESGNK